MHILLVTSYFEPDSGAAAVRLSRLARLLHERGHQVTVLTTLPSYPQGRIAEGYRDAWEVVEASGGLRIIRTWLWATPSPRISRKMISQISFMLTAAWRGLSIPKPDVVLIEAQPVFTCLAGVVLSLSKRVPYVLNVSDLWPDHLLSVGVMRADHPVYRMARKIVDSTYRRAAGIVAMSPQWAEAIRQHIGSPPNPQIIYNGVDLERFRPGLDAAEFRRKYHLGDQKLITFIGTFATQYDFDVMFAAARRLADCQGMRFVLIGGGSQAEVVQRHLSDGHLRNVDWIPWVEHREMPYAWAASSVTFWAMRDHELYRGTIPAKLYEAMACGVPVVAAIEGVAAEMMAASGCGIAVACGDVDALIKGIQRMAEDNALWQQCSLNARAYAEEHFDPNRVAEGYEAALKQAID